MNINFGEAFHFLFKVPLMIKNTSPVVSEHMHDTGKSQFLKQTLDCGGVSLSSPSRAIKPCLNTPKRSFNLKNSD